MTTNKGYYEEWLNARKRQRGFFDEYLYYGRRWNSYKDRHVWPKLPIPETGVLDLLKRSKLPQLFTRRPYRGVVGNAKLQEFVDDDSLIQDEEVQTAVERFLQFKDGFGRPGNWKCVRALGWGGNGLAMLFEQLDDDNKHLGNVVVKASLKHDRDYDLRAERGLLQNHAAAEHIVHVLPNSLADQVDVVCMEFMEHGSLDMLIDKLVRRQIVAPNRVLWRFWLCLVKAVVVMAYPLIDTGKQVSENVRPGVGPSSLVHFDIDPQNVLVGSLDAEHEEHDLAPVLKLGDFGLAEYVRKEETDEYYAGFRRRGKFGYYTPEQFTPEWDYIDSKGKTRLVSEERTAGQYSAYMNLWGMAWSMWSLITKLDPPMPPVAEWASINDESIITYGAVLLEDDVPWGYVDRNLRNEVVRCLAHYPDERPRLAAVHQTARNAVQNTQFTGQKGESDAEVLDWMQNLLRDGPKVNTQQGPSTGLEYGLGLNQAQTAFPPPATIPAPGETLSQNPVVPGYVLSPSSIESGSYAGGSGQEGSTMLTAPGSSEDKPVFSKDLKSTAGPDKTAPKHPAGSNPEAKEKLGTYIKSSNSSKSTDNPESSNSIDNYLGLTSLSDKPRFSWQPQGSFQGYTTRKQPTKTVYLIPVGFQKATPKFAQEAGYELDTDTEMADGETMAISGGAIVDKAQLLCKSTKGDVDMVDVGLEEEEEEEL
ncbi:kinase-like domain-containing protein [Xylariales sp. AK1849]|nr:kinase-like domain-containing protein [Xylariales sp. AK1849]